MKAAKPILRWRTVGWGVLFGLVCIVLCFHFPTEYKWGLSIAGFAIAFYNILAVTRLRRAIRNLERTANEVEKEK
jgi:hypothetical protein